MTLNKRPLNNFDFLRILAASMVLFSHQLALSGLPEPLISQTTSLGGLGVAIFFSMSGYLITQSWFRDPHIFRFIARRFLRIWPALLIVTCLAAWVVGPIVSTLSNEAYFDSELTWRYFRMLRLCIEYTLPGVFTTNPYPHAVNGSLWTIPLEVKWYGILLLAGMLRVLHVKWLVLAATVLLALYHFGVNQELNYLREYGLYFMYGISLYLFFPAWQKNKVALAVIVSLLAGITGFSGHPAMALWIALPYFVIVVGLESSPVIRRFGRFGDISYGIYIYAFLVQQSVLWLSQGQLSFWVCLIISFATTILLAFASWHLIEKPALRLKPRMPFTYLERGVLSQIAPLKAHVETPNDDSFITSL